jgi:hypothetical protein
VIALFTGAAVAVAGLANEATAAPRHGGGGGPPGGGGGFHAGGGGGFHLGGGGPHLGGGGFHPGGAFHAAPGGFHPGFAGGIGHGFAARPGRTFTARPTAHARAFTARPAIHGRGVATRPAIHGRGVAARPTIRGRGVAARGNLGREGARAGRVAAPNALARHNAAARHNALAAHNGFGGRQLTSHQFAHNQFAAQNFHGLHNFNQAGFNRNAFGDPGGWNDWGGQFWGAGWNDWGGGWGGWAGPVFWPFLYGDLFSYFFWPYDYYDPFWAYGPDFILASIFAPGPYFGSDYGYGPDYYDYAGSANIFYGSGPAPNLTNSDRQTLAKINTAATQSCSGLAPGVDDLPITQIRQTIHPTQEQAALLDNLNAASNNAAKVVADSCPSQIPLTPVDRLNAAEKRISAMIQAVQIVRTPLEKFYDSLSDEQKQRFDQMGRRQNAAAASNSSPEALCGNEASDATSLPVQRIEQVVRPNSNQQHAFDGLKAAAAKAAQHLQASCPTSAPNTPVARLDAAAARLKAIAAAMNDIRPALQNFYASLSDEQKARFNTMGPPQSASATPRHQSAR